MKVSIRPQRALTLLFFLSGFAALILETIWARQLSLLFGSGVRAVGAVVVLTLAGLALGSRWAGLAADRMKRPLAAYALLEGGIALWALLTPFLFRWLPLLASNLPDSLGGGIDLDPAAFLATSLFLLPGTLLMGATTPYVVMALVQLDPGRDRPGRSPSGPALGWLYGWNTLGGALGAIVTVFVLLPTWGLGTSLQLVAALGWLVALGAGILGQQTFFPTSAPNQASPLPEESHRPRVGRRSPLTLLFLAGLAGGMCQIAWTRGLALLFGSSVHAFGLTLSVYLAGLALGSLAAGKLIDRGYSPLRVGTGALLVAIGSTLSSLPLWGGMPLAIPWVGRVVGVSFGGALATQLGSSILLLLLPAAAVGGLLPVLAALLPGGRTWMGRNCGDGYSLDTWGTVAGVFFTSHLLLPMLGVERTLKAAILIEAAALIPLGWRMLSAWRAWLRLALGGVWAMTALGVVYLVPRWDPALMTSGPILYGSSYASGAEGSWNAIADAIHRRGTLRFIEEGPVATVTVREGAGGLLSLQINGKTDASTGGDLPTQLLAGHLPALLHPSPRSALVIGLASGMTAGALGHHPLERIDCVEISPGVVRAAAYFGQSSGGILADPRLHIFIGDGRAHLQKTDQKYDVITSQPTNPWIAGVTNLFTREFFLLARSRLQPGGVLGVWVQGYALPMADFKSIARTFSEVFPNALIWEESAAGGDYFLVGKNRGEWPSAEALAERLTSTYSLRMDLERAGIEDTADLLSRFLSGPQGLSALARDADLVTDDNLRLEYSTPRSIWGRTDTELIAALEEIRQSPRGLLPFPDTPRGAAWETRLQQLESRRGDRIRLALTLRRSDWEALSSPDLATAVNLARAGLFDAALPFLRRARAQSPEAPSIPILMGWLLLDGENLEGAADAFGTALKLDPASAEAANGMGMALWRMGDAERAEPLFRIAHQNSPRDPDPANNLASALLARQRNLEALSLLEEVVSEHPRHVPSRINKGVALSRLGRYGEATREYLEALALDPRNADAAYNLARARERARKSERDSP